MLKFKNLLSDKVRERIFGKITGGQKQKTKTKLS